MARKRAYWVALACLGWAGYAHALGLGEIEIRSRLNQPIAAVIPLSAAAGETDDLVVSLASNEEFERAGLERPEFLSSLRFEVQGETIKVTSKQIAREPFVSFLLDVRWSGGRLLREYTVLLDPPALAQSAPTRPAPAAQAAPAPAATAEAATPPPAASPSEAPAPEAPAPDAPGPAESVAAPSASSAPVSSAEGTYGPVSPKETLWSIAYKLRPDPATITMDQMQVAIFNANPQAFHQGRLTGLMKGSTLRIPSSDEIRAVDPVAAKSQVAEARAGGAAAPAPSYQAAAPAAAPSPEPAPEPKPEPKAEPQPEPSAAAPPVETAPTPPPEVAQAPVETPPAETPPPTEAAPAPTPAPAPVPAEEPKTEPAPQPAAAPPAPEEPGMVAELLERGRGLLDNPLVLPAAAGFVVLLLLLFGGRKLADKIAKLRYERAARKEQVAPVASAAAEGSEDVTEVAPETPSMQAALDEAAAGGGPTVTMGTAPAVAATQAMGQETMQQTMQQTLQQPVQQTQSLEPALAASGKVDFDVTGAFASETVQINLDAGDPVSEAEFHRAYGLYDEAALLLKQALQKDPKRTDARVKLAEIYFEANKAGEFVEVAKELKAQLPEPEWQKIALLGTQIAPGNELFSGGGGVSVAGGVDLSFDEPGTPAAAPAAPAAAPAAPAADAGLDFKLEEVQLPETPAAPAAAPAAPAGDSLEFDLGSLSLDSGATPAQAAPAAPAAPAGDAKFDLGDFDLSAPAAAPASGGEVVELGGEVSMEAPVGAGDESSTKLDLARAYIDMGDADMAKSLLNEVAQQGNAEQQKEAQELLKRVSG